MALTRAERAFPRRVIAAVSPAETDKSRPSGAADSGPMGSQRLRWSELRVERGVGGLLCPIQKRPRWAHGSSGRQVRSPLQYHLVTLLAGV